MTICLLLDRGERGRSPPKSTSKPSQIAILTLSVTFRLGSPVLPARPDLAFGGMDSRRLYVCEEALEVVFSRVRVFPVMAMRFFTVLT